MKRYIGIQQGRLSPRRDGKLQSFPHGAWQREFSIAARIGFDAIEWLFESDRAEQNPLCSAAGRAEIKRVTAGSGVSVRSVCASYFIVNRLAGDSAAQTEKNVRALCELIDQCAEIGAQRLLLPLLEGAAVDTPELQGCVLKSLEVAAPIAARAGLVLGLEMEIAGSDYAALVERAGHPSVRAYYDTGNSTAQGFDIAVDVKPLLPLLCAVHVKDRKVRGGSVPIGSGDTNYDGFLRTLAGANFTGDFVFEHFFENDPEAAARAALGYLREHLALAEKAA
ncbi:MAG TPA: sugar phosphate isomerase/epimerase family protein [Polyangiaceae bacterium]|nr:sugar phosphate isomerase/epimerase family protein [Polyangiaceae bacterium]